MQWSDEPHAGFTTGEEPCRPLAEDGPFAFPEVNVARQRREPGSMLNWMERLIRRRRECPELGWGEWTLLAQDEPAVFAHRADWGGSTVVAVHNLGGRAAQARLELGEEGLLVDLLGEQDVDGGERGGAALSLEPYDHRWFRLRRPGQRVAP
jgi:maltose alpha-D-glucosyltransferase/alpha-amylase